MRPTLAPARDREVSGRSRGARRKIGNAATAQDRARHGAHPATFSSRVLLVVRRIPPGRVATYGDIAALAGRPRAARAVGNIMRACARPDVPCHRVIAAGGRLGGYGGSEALKRALLAAEGVPVSGSRVRQLDRVRWLAPSHVSK